VISRFECAHPNIIVVHELRKNRGAGKARRVAVSKSSHELVAVMDADDIAEPTRFETQLTFLQDNPEVDIVGSYISEFTTDPDEPHAVRTVPTDHDKIVSMAHHRSPMNQTTVLFRRSAVIAAGNYRDVSRLEDYGLWVRMILNGARFANIPEPLVKVRAGSDMYERRSGWTYAREEVRFQIECWRRGFLSPPESLLNACIRVPIRLAPDRVRAFIYSEILRSDNNV
jgi:glycosyltransferase involved in cell wall biosynthesis